MKLILQKLERCGYRMVKKIIIYLQPFLTDPLVWRTDRRSRRTDAAIAYMLYAMLCIYAKHMLYAVAS